MSRYAKRLTGIAAIALAVLIVILGVTKPNPFADRYTYWAEFDTAQGLGKIDRDVRIAGVKVGTIGNVEREGDDLRAEIILYEDFELHSDARAAMRPHTLFEGSNFVDLAPGSPGAPVLEQGGTIPIDQTSNYVTLDEALRILRPEIRTNLRQLADVGARTLRGEAIEGVQETLRNAPDLMRSLAPAARAAQGSTRVELTRALQGVAKTADAVAEREEDLVPTVRGLAATAAGLNVEGGRALDAALVALPPALRELQATAPSLTSTIDSLDRLAVAITPALPELGLAVQELTPVVERTIPVLRRATPLVEDARLVADRLGKARAGLTRMFELLPDSLRKAERALGALNETSMYGTTATEQAVGGAFSGFAAALRGFQTKANSSGRPGHVQRIGVLFGPDSLTGAADFLRAPSDHTSNPATTLLECDDVASVSPKAARAARAAGACE
jgi:phospholipid/cholesterol/gamma-HCH transport system substrate-binding protein